MFLAFCMTPLRWCSPSLVLLWTQGLFPVLLKPSEPSDAGSAESGGNEHRGERRGWLQGNYGSRLNQGLGSLPALQMALLYNPLATFFFFFFFFLAHLDRYRNKGNRALWGVSAQIDGSTLCAYSSQMNYSNGFSHTVKTLFESGFLKNGTRLALVKGWEWKDRIKKVSFGWKTLPEMLNKAVVIVVITSFYSHSLFL